MLLKVRLKYSEYVVSKASISPETRASNSFFEHYDPCGAKRVRATHPRSAYQSYASHFAKQLLPVDLYLFKPVTTFPMH